MKIKFLTLNIWEGGLLFPQIKEFLKKEEPDIMAFQEVFDGKNSTLTPNYRTLDELKTFLPDFQYHFAVEMDIVLKKAANDPLPLGNAIFSRFPIVESSTTFFDIPFGRFVPKTTSFTESPKNIQGIQVKVNETELNVFNLHGIWGLDGEDNPRRLAMGETIVQQIKGKKNVILAGDFNLKPHTQTVATIEKHVRNVFKNELVSTFNMEHKSDPGYATAVVDMVFTSPDMRVVEHYCPAVDVSDHLPLVIEVEV